MLQRGPSGREMRAMRWSRPAILCYLIMLCVSWAVYNLWRLRLAVVQDRVVPVENKLLQLVNAERADAAESARQHMWKTLLERFRQCKGCKVSVGNTADCELDVTRSLDYLPDADILPPVDRKMMNRASASFHNWLCSLPVTPFEKLSGSSCTFERTMDNIFCEITVGKTLKLWTFTMLRHSIGFGPTEGKYRRFVFNPSYVKSWKWKLSPSLCENGTLNGFRGDSCDASLTQRELPSLLASDWVEIGKMAFQSPQAASTILLLGLTLRRILEGHLAECVKSSVQSRLMETVDVVDLSQLEAPLPPHCVRGPAISMHIRRGDACERWKSKRGFHGVPRPCYPTRMYLDAALEMKRLYGVCRILLATDSDEVISELKNDVDAAQFRITALSANRSLYKPLVKGQIGFIENREFTLESHDEIITSAIADVKFLGEGDFFIGNLASTISRLAYFLISASTGRVAPYSSMDSPLDVLLHGGSCSFWRW
mmetsp:Transcript_13904/g.25736  ORF Transcript_13904/g.25736 Transcript_13904/m.25736 type:complete len:484 (+) Transcript_13904:36-1487(+)